jgi:hypothetical protein
MLNNAKFTVLKLEHEFWTLKAAYCRLKERKKNPDSQLAYKKIIQF